MPSQKDHLTGDMPPEEFRRLGYQIVDWIADYLNSGVEHYPVLAQSRPGDILKKIPSKAPAEPESADAILEDFQKIVLPGITHWNHPAFLAYFSSSASGPGILGELLSSALNINGMLWQTSPAATELEEAVLGWLRGMLGLSENFWGIIYDTASISTLHALAAARQFAAEKSSSSSHTLCLYTSKESHSSVEKATLLMGIEKPCVRRIPVDSKFRMIPGELAKAIREDRQGNRDPFCVVATVGTTSTTSIDPVSKLADICESEGLWLHVDAAHAGIAAIIPEKRWILDGCEGAHSVVVNPHKWLFTPIDLSAFYCRFPETLRQAFSIVPAYLKSDSQATNYMDYGIQLGRRFRALKLWMVIRYFGTQGLANRIRQHIQWGQEFAERVDRDPAFERLAPSPLSTICFRARPPGSDWGEDQLEALNVSLLKQVNQSGEIYLSHTRLNGTYALRLSIGNIRTRFKHVDHAWRLLRETLARELERR